MEETAGECKLCHDTGCLPQWGIFVVYLTAAKIPLFIMLVSLAGVIACSSYFYIAAVFGFIIPLVQADFRMYLYPVAVIAKIAGKKLNCPKCNPQAGMFKRL